ncbi:hypothetical protein EUGRSUZ_E02333 [Eucalyptus grandis]|uniref:Uncharacterized protein n=2 Tax=Eucalyptus grandis TaxID=71139 RepID=A0ACC3KWN3_EUCGR|nr:hypothetical protein EUGRSUZ_E02333 [Eucalyptus grandis]
MERGEGEGWCSLKARERLAFTEGRSRGIVGAWLQPWLRRRRPLLSSAAGCGIPLSSLLRRRMERGTGSPLKTRRRSHQSKKRP